MATAMSKPSTRREAKTPRVRFEPRPIGLRKQSAAAMKEIDAAATGIAVGTRSLQPPPCTLTLLMYPGRDYGLRVSAV